MRLLISLILGAALLSAQGLQEKEKIVRNELHLLSFPHPILQDATVKCISTGCVVKLNSGANFIIPLNKVTVDSLLGAIQEGVGTLIPKDPVTFEIAEGWFKEFAASEPDLRGLVFTQQDLGYGWTYYGFLGPDHKAVFAFKVAPGKDTKENFVSKLRENIRGDDLKNEAPEGVAVGIGPGAARVIGITGIRFMSGDVHFFGMPEKPSISMRGDHLENRSVFWVKVNETDLQMIVTHNDGTSWVYAVHNGKIDPRGLLVKGLKK